MSSKDQELRRKRKEVTSWLSEVFGQETVPEFEINPQTIEVLYHLSTLSHYNEKNATLCIEDLKKKTDEYNADAQRVGAILRRLMLGQGSFSSSGEAYLQALAQSGAALGVCDASDTSYLLCLQDLNAIASELSLKLISPSSKISKMSQKTQDMLVKRNLLEKTLETMEEQSPKDAALNQERKEEAVLLKNKTQANESKITKLQTELAKTGLTEADFHVNLLKKKEKLDELESTLGPLQSELQSYASLPPNAVEAKVKIEQLKQKLHQLQTQMSECVDVALT